MSAPVINLMPHVMDQADIDAFVREYATSARLVAEGRADGVEIHLNHDDLHEWFLSPVTNQRSDRYGGSLENRCRFTREVLQAIREAVGDNFTVGVRMNLREEHPRGYQVEGAIQIAQYLESTGLIDYVHGVVGNPWGNPSYIQPDYFQPAQWSQLAGQLRRAIGLPVVYTGKVNSPEVAESVLASGHADVVGLARAIIADGELIAKAERGESDQVRPCIGCNECISRRYVEGIPFSCTVNPTAGQERWRPARTDRAQRRLLVVGGGPAGLELAASMAEAGVQVTLWEAEDQLGGQLRYAMQAPGNHRYTEYLDWQTRRLDRLGVELQTGFRADAAEVLKRDADWVAFATGAGARRPNIPGVDQDWVLEARDVLAGRAQPGQRVAIVAQDDHLPPLLLADFLSERGHEVTLIYGTNGPAQLIGRYTLGAIMGRLDARDVTIHTMQEVTAIGDHSLSLRHVYSTRERDLGPWDSIVLACGGVSVTEPYNSVKAQRGGVHVLGDAYAPRRAVFATRQAHALARSLLS
jgi:NADPH-dependent 2,4-dienoyl-CoA reductase/sulfur reductase-like enzyme